MTGGGHPKHAQENPFLNMDRAEFSALLDANEVTHVETDEPGCIIFIEDRR